MKILQQCLFFLLLSPLASFSLASTFWAACGEGISNGGETLVAYVRDDLPGEQTFAAINEEGTLPFKGIFVGKTHRFEAGLNERGLFVGQISVASVSRNERLSLFPKRFKSPEGWFGGEWLTRHCSSVDEALKQRQVLSGYPMIYVLADKTEIAFVECLPNGQFKIRRATSGVLSHTNHYVLPETTADNRELPASSSARLVRIRSLLSEESKPYQLEQFLSMALDTQDGPDFSIYRVGSKPRSPKTTAVWLLKFPGQESPVSYLRLLNETSWETVRERFPATEHSSPVSPLEPLSKKEPPAAIAPESSNQE